MAEMTPQGAIDDGFDAGCEIATPLSETAEDAGGCDPGLDDGFEVGRLSAFASGFDEGAEVGPRGYRIIDIAVIRDDLYALVETMSSVRLERLSVPPEGPDIREASWFGDQISGLDFNDYTGITDGAFKIALDGVTSTVDSCDFSLSLKNADIAAELQRQIRRVFGGTPTVRIHQGDRFVVTSATRSDESQVSVPTAANKGTDLATAALLGAPGDAYGPEMPFSINLDSRVEVTGTFDEATGYTTWDHQLEDKTMTEVVLGRGFGAQSGGTLASAERVNANKLRAEGDFSGADVYVGRPYKMRMRLSRPYIRDQSGVAVLDGRMHLRQLIANHQDSGAYTVEISNPDRAVRSSEFKPLQVGVDAIGSFAIEATGEHSTLVMANADNVTVELVSDSALPVTITSLEWTADYARRSP